MRISLNALRQVYAQTGSEDPTAGQPIEKIVEKIGAQLGEVEEVIDLGKRYAQAVVVKVVACNDHPDADRLKLCTIDDGGNSTHVKRESDGLIQVVCGAPNVRADMLAVWLPPGMTVPATYDKDPLVLEAREIRGQVSNGMLASLSELAIGDDHAGILEVDKKANPGDSFAKTYKLDDYIIDIENKMFTHRPDCFGVLGVARELSGIYGQPFTSPDWYVEDPAVPKPSGPSLNLEVVNTIPELAPRFCALAISDVKIGPSPIWLQVALAKAGIKAKNNIVDLTNFYMYYTGQPTHAYDYDKVAKLSAKDGAMIRIRRASGNEKLRLLNGREVKPGPNTIMIATDKHPIGIGGVIGGVDTEVDDKTKNIILECANFDPYAIRRTSMELGIFTDAVTRFTKSQSPRQNLAVITKIASDVGFLAGGKIASDLVDINGKTKPSKPLGITPEFINLRLGVKLSAGQINSNLSNVEFSVSGGDELKITVPFWRTDIEIQEDIVEEVGRLYGYDHLPLELPRGSMAPSLISPELELKNRIRDSLVALGANETLNYSFVRSDLLKNSGQVASESYKLKNALSPDLEYYRQSLTPSLLEKVHPNIKEGFAPFALFELGKVHRKTETAGSLPKELPRAALVVAAKTDTGQPAYYQARKYLVELLASLDVSEDDLSFTPIADTKSPDAAYYLAGRAATVSLSDEPIGWLGEYNRLVTDTLKLPDFCAGFEINLEFLGKSPQTKTYQALSRYPSIEQDICLKTPVSADFAEIKTALSSILSKHAAEDINFRADCIDIFSGDSKSKQTTFRITASSYKRTLTSQDINMLFEKSAADLKASIGAHIV